VISDTPPHAQTSPQPTFHDQKSRRSPFAFTIRHIVAIFLQGLFALLPLIVTAIILGWLGLTAERTLGRAIKWIVPKAVEHLYIPGMGVLAGIITIFLFGLLINIYGVPKLIHWGELLIGRVPLVKTIYGGVRDLLGYFSSPGSEGSVSKVVIVTFGDSGIKAVGLLTRENFDDLPEGLGGAGYVVVYFPYSYQIGGFSMLVPRESVQPIDMGLEDAMRYIVTAGAKSHAKP
jgi:uncharacterized membrane protein